eukprot:TRINITY_DN82478_c0_g1_i1.p1 TRINITY_DN82478_c0_g1~~TRINITY_DN82478_c0_g1_i1.p1  ORF type:complete len:140 (+),score=36.12 TRINITY_DN82478_c0_g1_i1:103-522(+)
MPVRNKTIKRASRLLVEKYYHKLTRDFHSNKRLISEVATVPSKRLRNNIVAFTTHLMKRIARGPVRGISLRLQEEERERRMDFVPEVSIVDQDIANGIEVDETTMDMLASMDLDKMSHLRKSVAGPVQGKPAGGRGRKA